MSNVDEVNAATIEGSVATLLELIDTPKLAKVGTKLVVDPPAGVILILNVNSPLLSVLSDELNVAETAPNEFEVEPSFVNDPEAILLVTIDLCEELSPGCVLSAVYPDEPVVAVIPPVVPAVPVVVIPPVISPTKLVEVTEDKPAKVVTVAPRATAVLPIVTEEFVSELFAIVS